MLVTGIFLGVYAFLEYPREIGRWQMAAANEFWTEAETAALRGEPHRAAENRDKAFAKLEEALKWSPDDVNWLFARALWNSKVGKQEAALSDCNRVISQIGERSSLLGLRMEIYQQLGRHAEAVQDAKQLDAISQTSGSPSRGESLNNVAYVKAVGKIELPAALKQSDESVRSAFEVIKQNKLADEAELSALERFFQAFLDVDNRIRDNEAKRDLYLRLDTRGFVHFQMGNYQRALADLETAANGYSKLLDERDRDVKLQRAYPDSRRFDINLAKERRGAAVIFYHRALAHEKLGHTTAAAADRKRVRELIGRDGDEKLF